MANVWIKGPARRTADWERFWLMRTAGVAEAEIAAELNLSRRSMRETVQDRGGVAPRPKVVPSGRFLVLQDRIEIALGLARGWTQAVIAAEIGVSAGTISRELQRNRDPRPPGYRGRLEYDALRAQRRADKRAERPKQAKLRADVHQELHDYVQDRLTKRWSPEQISNTLRIECPDRLDMQVSHETIYQAIYVQSRGALKRELAACLRTGRAVRRPKKRVDARRKRSQIPDELLISERPAEAEDRAVPGHWEGDLIMGAGNQTAIGTLVERTTRFCMLLHLPGAHGAAEVRDAIIATIQTLPEALRRSLTWDQGVELSSHAEITFATDLAIYFCDPHSPWQRGSNENTNGLLRQYFPKSTDLSIHTADYLRFVADELNDRPRETLGWRSPRQALTELLATTG